MDKKKTHPLIGLRLVPTAVIVCIGVERIVNVFACAHVPTPVEVGAIAHRFVGVRTNDLPEVNLTDVNNKIFNKPEMQSCQQTRFPSTFEVMRCEHSFPFDTHRYA